jgi:hypothetical protein
MNRDHTDQYRKTDSMHESISDGGIDAAVDRQLRSRRIAEYKLESLQGDDLLRANMGAAHADLLEITELHGKALIKSMRVAKGDMIENPHLQRAISTHVNLTRQAGRLANFELGERKKKQVAETAKAEGRMMAMPISGRRNGAHRN